MLEVELDIFSGMPNPRWLLTQAEERELAERLEAEPEQVSPLATEDEQFALGYRGLIVRLIKPDEESPWARAQRSATQPMADEFRIGSKPATRAAAADWLLGTSEPVSKHSQVTDELRAAASKGAAVQSGSRLEPGMLIDPTPAEAPPESRHFPTLVGEGPDTPGAGQRSAVRDVQRGATWWACPSNYFSANASVFNQPEHVTRNNCYCFASNHLSGVRYALPGRRGGRPATSITCGGVIDGLYADGWRDGCQQDGLTIVLVIWPNYDYHFYRLVTGGPYWWWGHKPGGTPAKYTDDCGNAIYQYNGSGYAPNNCCRGNYTSFCGYFYQNNWTAYVA